MILQDTRNIGSKIFGMTKRNTVKKIQQFGEKLKPLSTENWYERTANTCENLADSIMHKSGWTNKFVKVATAKFGALAAPASIYTLAALVGTASTGTAIGSLSGAAFTSSTLAWLGGSVAMGTAIIGATSVGGLLIAPLLIKPIADKYLLGKARRVEDLLRVEKEIVDCCCTLAIGLRYADKEGSGLDKKQALLLHRDVFLPLFDKTSDILRISNEWRIFRRNRFRSAFEALGQSKSFAKHISERPEPIVVGLATVVVLNLLSAEDVQFSDAEQDVLNAIRRSSHELYGATNNEISEHVQSMSPLELIGFKNNIKGIAHEIRFARTENADGDEYIVELFEATNHSGADIRLINTLTGNIQELQLKASAYGAYVESHFDRYPEIDLLATLEVAEELEIKSSDISNDVLERDIENTLRGLDLDIDPTVLDSMAVAGLIMLARNLNTILTSGPEQSSQRKKMVAKATQASLVTGIIELLV